MRRLSLIFFSVFVIACNNTTTNNEHTKSAVPADNFRIPENLYDYSSQMKEGDTLVIYADLSACLLRRYEKNVITRNGSKILLKTYADEFVNKKKQTILPQVEYQYKEIDSLNFEDLLRYLNDKGIQGQGNEQPFLKVFHDRDTVRYYSANLTDQLDNGAYYLKIKERLYPKADIYQPIEVPPKPK